ncbi:OLC1v1012223C1 [Oldenlandia corymbosa var. corymbosa]|uniref:OLC1v1012223C1 n=1 Tax=Oldenlandia corymbosa var. corymbosa TaxID=529605 RepID=A0AAV1DW49_OLDCO|nr:OLC1v1012223C1 [Oldenlandia corymbosa var. corymbosa]
MATGEGVEAAGFGHLREDIIHRILSFLNDDDKKKARDLWKNDWSVAYYSYPKLWFNDRGYRGENSDYDEFRQDIENALLRYTSGGILLPYQLRITKLSHHEEDAARLDKWLKLAVENGVKELELQLFHQYPAAYIVPDRILESKSLAMLSLRNCEFQKKLINVQSLFRNIHTLILVLVSIDEPVLLP